MTDLPEVQVYTDGACSGNPGPGGWGAILVCQGKEKEISGGEQLTTNNRMEIMAALEALRSLKQACKVQIFTDSAYLQKAATQWMLDWKRRGWKRKEGKLLNAELWQALDMELARHEVSWEWVKGHAGHNYNERADRLARAAITKSR
jgi:ribonuclease HI